MSRHDQPLDLPFRPHFSARSVSLRKENRRNLSRGATFQLASFRHSTCVLRKRRSFAEFCRVKVLEINCRAGRIPMLRTDINNDAAFSYRRPQNHPHSILPLLLEMSSV